MNRKAEVNITIYYRVIYSLCVAMMLMLLILCIWVVTTPVVQIWKRVVFGFLGLIGFTTATEVFIAIHKTRLILCNTGIILVRPYFDLDCKWNEISGISIEGENLTLRYKNNVSITKRPLNKISIWQKNCIPVNLFTRKWKKQSTWFSDPILSYIQFYRPDLVNEIFQIEK